MNFSEPRKLTDLHASYLEAAFSPDGQQIAFAAHTQGLNDIYLMDRNGNNLTKLTDGGRGEGKGSYSSPCFNHDVSKIVCLRSDAFYEEIHDVYLIDLETRQGRQLTTARRGLHPRFSPDGKHIVYSYVRSECLEIFLMTAEGQEQTQLTHTEFAPTLWKGRAPKNFHPFYSPDGQYIVFKSNVDWKPGEGDYQLYTMRPDGSEQKRITSAKDIWSEYLWHPDSRHLAYTIRLQNGETEPANWRVCLAGIDGSPVRSLYQTTMTVLVGAFSPNGRFLAFYAGRKPPLPEKRFYWNLYLLDTETGGVTQLPHVDGWNGGTCFSPDGKTLLYISKTANGNELFIIDIDAG
jgi:Tol biopolymer transport system component